VLEKHGVELIGASARAIAIAEDRKQFGEAMERLRLGVAKGGIANTFDEADRAARDDGLSRRSCGRRSRSAERAGIAYNREEFEDIVRAGSPSRRRARSSSSAR
jgi:carbamoyl-phosphate synthase large subunit